MKPSSSRLWVLLGPPLSVLLLLTALYVKKPWARDFIDQKLPWVRSGIGRYAPPFEVRVVRIAPPTPAPVEEIPPRGQRSAFSPPPAVAAEIPAAPAVKSDTFDLEKVCADPARWPKTVHLKAPVEFPAVLEGKVVGKLRVVAGTEARVVKVSAGKVGVEYRGGGAWLDFESTDFVERARVAWR